MQISKLFINILCLLVLGLTTAQAQQSGSADDIIHKSDLKTRGKSSISITTMKIVRPTWEREVTFSSRVKGHEYAMTVITAPAKEKGQSFLKRKKEMWSWNPTISRTIKLPTSMMSQGWMGSDYTNDDILKESSIVEDYIPSKIGDEIISNTDCYKIELKAKANAPVVWERMVKWISKSSYIQMKTEYYDEEDTLMRTDNVLEVKKMDDREVPSITEIIPADKNGYKTIVNMNEIKFNIDIDESSFSQQNLKRLK